MEIMKLPIESRRETTNEMIKSGNYTKSEVTDLINYANNLLPYHLLPIAYCLWPIIAYCLSLRQVNIARLGAG